MHIVQARPPRAHPFLILLGLFLAAFLVRATGLDFGYFLGDERIGDAAKVLTGQIVPGDHYYPPLVHYLNAVAFGVLFGAGWLLGIWPDTAAFRAEYFSDPTVFYLTARVTTALFGALLAPMFYLVGRSLDLSHRAAIIAGLIGVLMPLAIHMSHIAKGDTALAVAGVAVVAAMLYRHRLGRSTARDILLGVAVTMAVSFKHSFVLIAFPLALVHVGLLAHRVGSRAALASAGRSILAILVLWPVLNIGILLDFRDFIVFQKIQSVMSFQSGGSYLQALQMMAARAMEYETGITPAASFLALLFPVYLVSPTCQLPQKALLAGTWAAVLVSILVTAKMVGLRQPEHFWLSQLALMQLFAALMIADLMRAAHGRMRVLGRASLGLVLAMSLVGSGLVLRQALMPPMSEQLNALILRDYADRRIFTGTPLTLAQSAEAAAWETARLDRVARKYDVEMPERAAERFNDRDTGTPVYFLNAPGGLYGLENASEEDLKGIIRPYAWPLQPEEWTLSFWRDLGVDVFIVRDLASNFTPTSGKLFRAFYTELVETCVVAETLKARKPLFLEFDITILTCAD